MPEDRSLDEFAGDDVATGSADADEERDDTDEERRADSDAVDAATAVRADPATSTATWTTGGAACDRCGDSVSRRWLDDDVLVCAACKEW